MYREKYDGIFLTSIFILSFLIRLYMILTAGNSLTLGSDDLNYVKSAAAFLKTGVLSFHQYNEPTVFIMPLYPLFIAMVFKVAGSGINGLQVVRIIQAIISSGSVIIVYKLAKIIFSNKTISRIACVLTAVYIPLVITSGFMLTETPYIFTFLLLIYYSLKTDKEPCIKNILITGFLCAVTVLFRPVIAFYPLLFAGYLLLFKKKTPIFVLRIALISLIVYTLVLLPWWIRNYYEYGEFIPLAASGGNPLLQGAYPWYKQTTENTIIYTLGKNAYETNKIEVKTAIEIIKNGFSRDLPGYLKWYTIDKTYLFWMTVFYWRSFFNISLTFVTVIHYILLTGLGGIVLYIKDREKTGWLAIIIVSYFNIIHCIYMAFDRYALPLMPLLAIFSAYFLTRLKKAVLKT